MAKLIPVYEISDFDHKEKADFYVKRLNLHVREHRFTNLPHKHDFYLTMIVTKGMGWHEIDFQKYPVKPGSVFFMKPGQVHSWKMSADIDGFVFFHRKTFFDEGFSSVSVNDFPFFKTIKDRSFLKFPPGKFKQVEQYFIELLAESETARSWKNEKIRSLMNLIYIEFAREYKTGKHPANKSYLQRLGEFENLLEKHFQTKKSASEYASLMNISEKHLNRIVRETVNKTSTDFIADRLILEAKRLLMKPELSVNEIAYELGFNEASYFIRFFKKNTGVTPLGFRENYISAKN